MEKEGMEKETKTGITFVSFVAGSDSLGSQIKKKNMKNIGKKERKSEVTWHAELAVVTAVKRLLLVRMKFWQVSSRDKPAQLLKKYFKSGLEIVFALAHLGF